MFGVILKATNSSFQKAMPFCRSIFVKKVMKLLAFIFKQPSYTLNPFGEDLLEGKSAASSHANSSSKRIY